MVVGSCRSLVSAGGGGAHPVPLHQEQHGDGDPRGGAVRGERPAEARHRRADPGLGGHERDAEPAAQRHSPVARRAGADVVQFLDRVQGPLPFRDDLVRHERLEGGDERGAVRAAVHAGLVLGGDPRILLVPGPAAVAGTSSAATAKPPSPEAARMGRDVRGFLVLAAAVTHQDQGTGTLRAVRRPQHAGKLAEG
jgi:hypothetical protein